MSSTKFPPMGVRPDSLPVSDTFVSELILECVDALLSPMWDHSERDGHREQISEVLSNAELTTHLRDLLIKADCTFEEHSRMNMIAFLGKRRSGDRGLAEQLMAQVPQDMQYLYHGTVFGKLGAIADKGLAPERPSIWEGMVEEEHLQDVVFFDQTWRGALDWATATSARSKGPKTSKSRQPVVLRVKRGDHIIEPDRKATKPGCFFICGTVPALDAEVLIGEQRGIPSWIALRDVANKC